MDFKARVTAFRIASDVGVNKSSWMPRARRVSEMNMNSLFCLETKTSRSFLALEVESNDCLQDQLPAWKLLGVRTRECSH